MSYESTDERIERMEKSLAEQIQTQKASLGFWDRQGEMNVGLLKLCLIFSNEHVAILRFLASSPLVADERTRRDFLDRIARMESSHERCEAMVKRLKQGLKTSSPGAPPPDESVPPISPT